MSQRPARLFFTRRLPLLIAARARAVERLGSPLPLVLVGGHPGEWEGEHPLAVARRLGNRQVFLAGWRAHEELPQALNAADLLVLPSVAEAFGLVLIEAMACGLPVIACRTHGPAGIVAEGKTGWLVPPDDQNTLTDALVAAVTNHEERLARGRRAHAESRHHGWPSTIRRLTLLSTSSPLSLPGGRQRESSAADGATESCPSGAETFPTGTRGGRERLGVEPHRLESQSRRGGR